MFSPSCKSSFPTISIVAVSSLGAASISSFVTSLTLISYLYTSVLKVLAISVSLIFKDFRPNATFSDFVIVISYIFVVPSSALTDIVNLFSPSFKSLFPCIETIAFSSSCF